MTDKNDKPFFLTTRPLTPEAFAPFGEVTGLESGLRRSHFNLAFESSQQARQPVMWVSYPPAVAGEQIEIARLERHPHSAQTFIPIREGRYLVVVCHADDAGNPDLSTLCALIAEADQAVTYKRNVWHHGLTVLDARTRFAVVTTLSGRNDDDAFFELGTPVRVKVVSAGEVGEIDARA
jgi:ureidoglycolate lyase